MINSTGLIAEPIAAPNDGAPDVATSRSREILFISHANPEDDTFAVWLATQLAIAGYSVWCDKTQLLGGEKFWADIEEGIEGYAFRVLFVSTLAGNTKPGALKELRIAFETKDREKIKDFVIPLKIDDFPYQSMHKDIKDLNCIPFHEDWAKGLSQLITLLERESAPRTNREGVNSVAEWYRRSIDARRTVVLRDETCHSNWFQLKYPDQLFLHHYTGPPTALAALASSLKIPHRVIASYLISFAGAGELIAEMGQDATFSRTLHVEPLHFSENGLPEAGIESQEAFNTVSDITRQAWKNTMDAKALGAFEMASGMDARFFAKDQLEKNRAYFQRGNKRPWRQMVGSKSKKTPDGGKLPDGFWHYAVSASPQLAPFPRLVLRHHVIFTDDGTKPWDKPDRMHKARRSVCKQWWNKEWRDRLFAFMSQIADGKREIPLRVAEELSINVFAAPMNFTSPWTYYEDNDEGLDESKEIELVEEPVDEEEDDTPPPA